MKPIFCVVLFATVHASKLQPRSKINQEGAGNDLKDSYGGGGHNGGGRDLGEGGALRGQLGGEFQQGSGKVFEDSSKANTVKLIQHPKYATSYQNYNLQSYNVQHIQPKKVAEVRYSGYGQDSKNWLGSTQPGDGERINGYEKLRGDANTWQNTEGNNVQQDWLKGPQGGVKSQEDLGVGHRLVFRVTEELDNDKKKDYGFGGQKMAQGISNQGGNEGGNHLNRNKEPLEGFNSFETPKKGWSQHGGGIARPKSSLKGQTQVVNSAGASKDVWRSPTSGSVRDKKVGTSQQEDGEMLQGQNTVSGAFGSDSRPLRVVGGSSYGWINQNDGPGGQKGNFEAARDDIRQGSPKGHEWVNQNWNNQDNSFVRPKTHQSELKEKGNAWNDHTEILNAQSNVGSVSASKHWENQGKLDRYGSGFGNGFRTSNKWLESQGSELVHQIRSEGLLRDSGEGTKDQGITFVNQKERSEVQNNGNEVWKSKGVNHDGIRKKLEGNAGSNERWEDNHGVPQDQGDTSQKNGNLHKGLGIQGVKRQQGGHSESFGDSNGGWGKKANGHIYNHGVIGVVEKPTRVFKGNQDQLYNAGGSTSVWGNPLGSLGGDTGKTEGFSIPKNVQQHHDGYFQQQTGAFVKLLSSSKGQSHPGYQLKEPTAGRANSWRDDSTITTYGNNAYPKGTAGSVYSLNKEAHSQHSNGDPKSVNGENWGSLSGFEDTKKGWQHLPDGLEVAKGSAQVYEGTNQDWKEQNSGFKQSAGNVQDQGRWFGAEVGSLGDVGSPIKNNGNQGSGFEAVKGSSEGVGSSTKGWQQHQEEPTTGLNGQGSWSGEGTGNSKGIQHTGQGFQYPESGFGGQYRGIIDSTTKWNIPASGSGTPVKGSENQSSGFGKDAGNLRVIQEAGKGYGYMDASLNAAQFDGAKNFGRASNGAVSSTGSSPVVQGNPGTDSGLSGWHSLESVANRALKGSGKTHGGGVEANDWFRGYKGASVVPQVPKANEGKSEGHPPYTYSFVNYGSDSKGASTTPGDELGVNGDKPDGYPDYTFSLGNENGKSKGSLISTLGGKSGVNGGQFEGYAGNPFSQGNYGGESNGDLDTVVGETAVSGDKSRVNADYDFRLGNHRGFSQAAANLPGNKYGVNKGKFDGHPQYTYSLGTYAGDSKGALDKHGSKSGINGGKYEGHPQYTYSLGTYGGDSKGALEKLGSKSRGNTGSSRDHSAHTYSLRNSEGAPKPLGRGPGANDGKFEFYARSVENQRNYAAADLESQESNIKRSDHSDGKLETPDERQDADVKDECISAN